MDSLAVAIGTCHGIYPPTMKPELKLDLLKEIKEKVRRSRWCCTAARTTPTTRSREAVQLGINKINISSDIKVAYHDKMREVLADEGLREPNCHPAAVHRRDEGGRRPEDRPVRRGRQGLALLTWPTRPVSCWASGGLRRLRDRL